MKIDAFQEGICPVCGKEVTYVNASPDYVWWKCHHCGAKGAEGVDYDEKGTAIFDGSHYDVKDTHGVSCCRLKTKQVHNYLEN